MTGSLMLDSVSGSGFSSSVGMLAANAQARETGNKFGALIDGIKAGSDSDSTDKRASSNATNGSISSSSMTSDPRLPGDFITSLAVKNPTKTDHYANPVGAAANNGLKGKIDKTSKLYEQSLELESYLVKIMLSSMRSTVTKSGLGGENDFAGKMYEDMQYDQLSRTVTQNAGFGLADQVYLQLKGNS